MWPRFRSAVFLAIESNADLHAVYDREGVPWVKIDPSDRWGVIPSWTTAQPSVLD